MLHYYYWKKKKTIIMLTKKKKKGKETSYSDAVLKIFYNPYFNENSTYDDNKGLSCNIRVSRDQKKNKVLWKVNFSRWMGCGVKFVQPILNPKLMHSPNISLEKKCHVSPKIIKLIIIINSSGPKIFAINHIYKNKIKKNYSSFFLGETD